MGAGPLLPALAFAFTVLLAGAFAWHAGFTNDDALISIRYAENLAAGNGLVYNAGERVLGTTTPLWTLLLAGFGVLGFDLPTTATVLGVLAYGWAGAATVLLLRAGGAPWFSQAFAALLVATAPGLQYWAGSGMETAAYVALIATFLWLFETERLGALGLVGGALLLVRPDAGLFLLCACVLHCWSERSVRPVLRVLPGFLLITAPWFIGATLYYGSPLPNSGFAKRLQVQDWGPFLVQLAKYTAPAFALAPFLLVGIAKRVVDPRRALPVACLLVFVLGMHFGSLPGCPWYFPPAIYLAVVLAAEGAYAVARALAGDAAVLRSGMAVAALVGALLGNHHLPATARKAKRDQAEIERLWGAVGDELARIAPPGARVAVDNIGYIGYRSGLDVVDIMGLVSAGVVEHLQDGDLEYAMRHHEPEFLAIWVGRGATPRYTPDQEWFDRLGYEKVFAVPVRPGSKAAYTIFSRLGKRSD